MKRCLWSSRASSSEPWKRSKKAYCRVQPASTDVVIDRGFLKLGGNHSGGSHNKEDSILGSILGSPCLGKLPYKVPLLPSPRRCLDLCPADFSHYMCRLTRWHSSSTRAVSSARPAAPSWTTACWLWATALRTVRITGLSSSFAAQGTQCCIVWALHLYISCMVQVVRGTAGELPGVSRAT